MLQKLEHLSQRCSCTTPTARENMKMPKRHPSGTRVITRSLAITLVAWLTAASTVAEAHDRDGQARGAPEPERAGVADGPGRLPELLPLPDVRQHTSYACGAAALQAVLAYYGLNDSQVRGDALM